MTLTTEQRSQINRENGKKSQGPKTDAGKAKSRQNAIKHGLRAEVLALPNEDPSIIKARSDSWNDYYQPASPAAQHLVNECVRATILSDRCHKYHDAALAKQVREADYRETCNDELEAERLAARLVEDPDNSVRGLLRFREGCHYLISRWEELGRSLERYGFWNQGERDEAIRLQGVRAEDDQLKNSDVAWTTRLYNLLSSANPNDRAIDWMMHPAQMPVNLRSEYSTSCYPFREECQALLKATVAEKITLIRAVIVELSDLHETVAKQSVADRAMILQDEKAAKLFLRYAAESRSAFHRSFKELVKTLDRDREEGATPLAVSPNEPNAEAVEEAKNTEELPSEAVEGAVTKPEPGVSPNEPNSKAPVEPAPTAKSTVASEKSGLPPEKQAA